MYIILLSLFSFFLNDISTNITYESDSNCFSEEEKEFSTELISVFEEQLNQYNYSYSDFLSKMAYMEIPPEFFVNSKTIKLINESSPELLNRLWGSSAKKYSPNFQSNFVKCLKNNSNSAVLIEIINTLDQMSDVSYGLIAGALESETTEKDYSSNDLKIFVSHFIYFEFVLNRKDQLFDSSLSILQRKERNFRI